jgi:CBS domain-containing protein/predicted flap endonuclease-1-like 5' DNA nuclease
MRVRDLMTRDVITCTPGTDLATAGMIMLRHDCGALPVTENRDGPVVGMITDRDIAMAVVTRHCAPDEVKVSDVVHGEAISVGPVDDMKDALQAFARARVRSLPVVGTAGEAVGILSLNDVILHTAAGGSVSKPGPSPAGLVRTMQGVSEHTSATGDAPAHASPARGGKAAHTRADPNGPGLTDVPGIHPAVQAKLNRAGIRTLDDLAGLEHDPERRRHVASHTGLSPAAALRFAGLAGILRLEGMTGEHFLVLIRAGIDSCEKLRGESKHRLVRLLSEMDPNPEETLEHWIGSGAPGSPLRP